MNKQNIYLAFDTIKGKIINKIENINLTDRDRKLLISACGLLLVIILYLAIFSFGSAVGRLEAKAIKLEADVLKVKQLKQEYITSSTALKKLLRGSEKRTTPLISEVEKILLDKSIDRKNFTIRDRQLKGQSDEEIYDERAVDVEIKNIPLNRVIDVLYSIQTRPSNLKISSLRLRTQFDNSNSIDLYFRVSTFKFNEVV